MCLCLKRWWSRCSLYKRKGSSLANKKAKAAKNESLQSPSKGTQPNNNKVDHSYDCEQMRMCGEADSNNSTILTAIMGFNQPDFNQMDIEPPPVLSGVAKMMAKMGYTGGGLGKKGIWFCLFFFGEVVKGVLGTGIVEPVVAVMQQERVGLGAASSPVDTTAADQAAYTQRMKDKLHARYQR